MLDVETTQINLKSKAIKFQDLINVKTAPIIFKARNNLLDEITNH